MQSRPECSSSDDHILINERKWEDITACEYSHNYELEHHISKFVRQWVRHENRRDREADGGIHWRLKCPKPRKVHYKTKWKGNQDAVYWIHFAKAREKCITFWQTKSHAIIAHKTVPPDCIEGVISQKVETSLYQRHSTPRPHPRIILKVPGISNSKVIWEASRIWSGRGTKLITTVLRKLRDTTTRTVS